MLEKTPFEAFNKAVLLHKKVPAFLVLVLEKAGLLIRGEVVMDAMRKKVNEQMREQVLDEIIQNFPEDRGGRA